MVGMLDETFLQNTEFYKVFLLTTILLLPWNKI